VLLVAGPEVHSTEPAHRPVTPQEQDVRDTSQPTLNLWGMDILLSNDGLGLGTFYRRQFSDDLYGFVALSISEAKDTREVERFDPFTGLSFTPGKLSRFMVIPLMVGVQRRLFREDIIDTFRPYVNAGVGPAMIYAMPFAEVVDLGGGLQGTREVEFFKSIGRGHPYYTLSSFVGFGAHFGSERSSVFGVNLRYYFTHLFSEGIPSLFNPSTGAVSSTKKDFGGFFITLNFGMAY
jgi:hypothetical protein